MNIPFSPPDISEAEINEVAEALRSGWITTGPRVKLLERRLAAYIETGRTDIDCNTDENAAKYSNKVVCLNSATASEELNFRICGIGEGDEVITTPITFAASSNCVLYCGGTPVFADINPETFNISPEDIERKITPKTKAIIAVHFTGQPCEMEQIHAIAHKYNLTVIEDGAHALGAEYQGKRVGTLSDMTTFSFHPVKHITTGEGGMILTNNPELYQRLKLFRTHGITREEELLTKNDGPWYYEQLDLGYNYRITDIQCALGVSQMDSWFYGGITLMGVAVLLAVVSIVIFKIKAPAFRKEEREFFMHKQFVRHPGVVHTETRVSAYMRPGCWYA